jgi:hypothetical protein
VTYRPAAAFLALIVAGCGSAAPAHKSAATVSARDKAVKFAECMRSNGVSDFPDPKASGKFPGYGISVSETVWGRAVAACKDLQPPGIFDAHRTPKQQTTALRFAQCMRANGVKDFPDPANGQPLIDTTHIPSSNQPGGMTILNAAARKCHALLVQILGSQ